MSQTPLENIPKDTTNCQLGVGADIALTVPMSRWAQFASELTKDMAVFLFFVLWSAALRMLFIALMNEAVVERSVFLVLLHGLRFDAQVAVFSVAPLLLASLMSWAFPLLAVSHATIRRHVGLLYCVFTSLLTGAMLLYYMEFHEAFSIRIFDLWSDDTAAILLVVADDPYSVLYLLAAMALGVFGYALLLGWHRVFAIVARRLYTEDYSTLLRTTTVLLFTVVLVAAGHGSIAKRPELHKWTAVTNNDVLNDAVMTPLSHIYYAVKDFRQRRHVEWRRQDNPYWKIQDIDAAYTVVAENAGQPINRKTGGNADTPQHIFLVVMESYDTWPLLPAYTGFGVSDALSEIRSEGAWFPNFAAQSTQTIDSFVAVILGLAHVGRPRVLRRETVSTALPEQMRSLGYRTRMFYGGMLNWLRLNDLSKTQGFDEAYGAEDMGGEFRAASWGLDDDALLRFVTDTVAMDTSTGERTFNVVMTLTYHPPFDLPSEKKTYKPPLLLPPHTEWHRRFTPEILSHLHFADRQLGWFYTKIKETLPGSLFVFTGDHYGRRFPHGDPSIYERESVAMVMAGHGIEAGRIYETPASHLDITATLIELASEAKGVPYKAIGRNLLSEETGRCMGLEGTRVGRCALASGVNAVFTRWGVAKMVGTERFELRPGHAWGQAPIEVPTSADWERFRVLRNATLAVSYDLLAQ